MTIGRVLAPGPATKLEMTRSSSDRVKDSSQLETIAGAMIGSVISRKARAGLAPRSMAASSSERSAAAKRDCTVMVTYAVQNVTCDSTMVVKPRCGQENSCSIDTNSSSCVIPVMISGMTSGAFTIPVSSSRPGKRAKRNRDFQRQQRRLQQLAVVQQLPIPGGGEATPDVHQRRGVERVPDQHQDRQVQQRDAEEQHRQQRGGGAPFPHPLQASSCRTL